MKLQISVLLSGLLVCADSALAWGVAGELLADAGALFLCLIRVS